MSSPLLLSSGCMKGERLLVGGIRIGKTNLEKKSGEREEDMVV